MAASTTSQDQAPSKTHPNDVGWQFVPQYYKYVNKHPDRLHCFYNKKSTFVHGDEGDDTAPCFGQHEIHEKITSLGYSDCKVYINSIDSQSSADGGIVILVIGEMANADGPWRKFTQTFFLAEQPNGYFVLNDIFRYLREADDEDDEEQQAPAQQEEAPKPEISEPVSTYTAKDTAPEVEEKPKPAPVEEVAPAVEETKPEVEEPKEEATTAADPVEEAPKKEEPAVVPPPKAPEPAKEEPKAAPAPAPEPAKPAAPAKPKSWASLAAGASGSAWGARATPAPVAASAPTPAAAPAAAPAPTPAAAPAQQRSGRHPAVEAVASVQTPHCFVKLPNWSISNEQQSNDPIDETTVRAAVTRFGEVVKVEIVKAKACAFVEFAKVESARKAIIASLPVNQGGEGGVKVGEGRLINLGARKEKEDRAKGAKRPQGQGQGQQQGQQGEQGQGQQGQPRQQSNGARGGRGGGARGGPRPQGGDKSQKA